MGVTMGVADLYGLYLPPTLGGWCITEVWEYPLLRMAEGELWMTEGG